MTTNHMTDTRSRLANARRGTYNGVVYVSIFDVLASVSRSKNVRKAWLDIRLHHAKLLDGAWTRLIFESDDRRAVATPAIMESHVSALVALVPGVATANVRAALVLSDL